MTLTHSEIRTDFREVKELFENEESLDLRLELVEQAVEIMSKLILEIRENVKENLSRETALREKDCNSLADPAASCALRCWATPPAREAVPDGGPGSGNVSSLHDEAGGETTESLG